MITLASSSENVNHFNKCNKNKRLVRVKVIGFYFELEFNSNEKLFSAEHKKIQSTLDIFTHSSNLNQSECLMNILGNKVETMGWKILSL